MIMRFTAIFRGLMAVGIVSGTDTMQRGTDEFRVVGMVDTFLRAAKNRCFVGPKKTQAISDCTMIRAFHCEKAAKNKARKGF